MNTVQHTFTAGRTIHAAAREMTDAAVRDRQWHEGEFNGITLVATPDDCADDVVRRYTVTCDEARAAYERSPEGQRARREAEEREAHAQSEVSRLLRALDSLDWSTHHSPLRWWREFTEHADHAGVTFHRSFVTGTFNAHGYAPDVNCGKHFRKGDPDNVARWIIGQCLDMTVKVGCPHHMVNGFIDEWLAANPQ